MTKAAQGFDSGEWRGYISPGFWNGEDFVPNISHLQIWRLYNLCLKVNLKLLRAKGGFTDLRNSMQTFFELFNNI